MNEVRYSHLRPEQFDERLEKFPVCFLPIGSLEWHYLHLPLGTDGLEGEELCVRTAQKCGGIVLPPLWFSITGRYRGKEDPHFGDNAKFYRNIKISDELFKEIIDSIISEAIGVGFKMFIVFSGHGGPNAWESFTYPWYESKKIAALLGAMTVYIKDKGLTAANDHAAFEETSLTSAIAPEAVDLSKLERLTGPYDLEKLKQTYSKMDSDRYNASPDSDNIFREAYIGGLDPRLGAGAETGKMFIDTIAERAAKFVADKYKTLASGEWPEFDYPFSDYKCWEQCQAFKEDFIQPDGVQRPGCGLCSETCREVFEKLEETYSAEWLKNHLEKVIPIAERSPRFFERRIQYMKKLREEYRG